MSKQEAMEDAKKYAEIASGPIYILRRGDVYKATRMITKGWKLAEIVRSAVQA